MLDRTTVTQAPTTTITGRELVLRLRRLSPRQRAALANDLVTGRVQLGKLTRKQAAKIAKVSLALVNEAVRGAAPQTVAAWWREAPFAERVDLIRSFGAADTWDALSVVVA